MVVQWGTVYSGVGLVLVGFCSGVQCVALSQAKLWRMDTDEWYFSFYSFCDKLGLGWASATKRLLSSCAVLDWCAVRGGVFCV